MKRYFLNTLVLLALVAFSGCGGKIRTMQEFNAFLSDPDNGFKVTRSVNGVMTTVIYLPPEYLAFKEMESGNGNKSKMVFDSVLECNRLSASFLMILAPEDGENKGDIMYKGLKDLKEYTARSLELNFDLDQRIELKTEEGSFRPVLSFMENTYSLTTDRKVNLVFAPTKNKEELKTSDHFDLVYSDETFGLGVQHFEFDKTKAQKILPVIVF